MKTKLFSLLITFLFSISMQAQTARTKLHPGFVYIQDLIPEIILDMRYCGHHNFLGKPVDGYLAPKAILSKKATEQLIKIENELRTKGLALKIFDAYRPQTAVNHFVRWAKDTKDTIAKAEFYPFENKSLLFKKGYIASKSGHSRGSTIDLTIISLKDGAELDMGSPFDYFGKISNHNYLQLSKTQKKNRLLLKSVMEKHGFKAYTEEWWHYTLKQEPFPDQYFDFPVE